MKHDDFYDKLYELAAEYKATRWWRPFKAHRLKKEIHRRWKHFIQEVCDGHNDTNSSAGEP